MYAQTSFLQFTSLSIFGRGRPLAAWLLLGLLLLLWQATAAQAIDPQDGPQAHASVTLPANAVFDVDHADPADFEVLPVLQAVAQVRPLPQRFDIATLLQVWGVQPGLPPPRVA